MPLPRSQSDSFQRVLLPDGHVAKGGCRLPYGNSSVPRRKVRSEHGCLLYGDRSDLPHQSIRQSQSLRQSYGSFRLFFGSGGATAAEEFDVFDSKINFMKVGKEVLHPECCTFAYRYQLSRLIVSIAKSRHIFVFFGKFRKIR